MIVRVVPDIPGLDKNFDYSVPPPLEPSVRPGAVVRVELNRRRVDAWVIDTGEHGAPGFDSVAADRLVDILGVAELGVARDVVALAPWVADRWAGPVRNVLASATPSRKKARVRNARRRGTEKDRRQYSGQIEDLMSTGGALLRVAPLASVLSVVETCAARGTVLVLCPTLRMARLGAAWLRRQGLSTAELPDETDAAIAGVDVVIGARSAVFADCDSLASIVVIDEHEEAYFEERVPTWWAPHVAVERAARLAIPVFLTSPVPSAAAVSLMGQPVALGEPEWPRIDVVDLNEVPVRGSLLSTDLIDCARAGDSPVLGILNTKGAGRVIVCKSCRALQACTACGGSVESVGDELVCTRCAASRSAVCGSCGRTSMVAARSGVSTLCRELSAASGREITEVTASTESVGNGSGVWIGTDALLHRVSSAGTVFFLDIDRDLSAPRMSAGREVLAAVARAARTVGRSGRVVIQTRQPSHPVVSALVTGTIDQWLAEDTQLSRTLGLPPFTSVAQCTFSGDVDELEVASQDGVEWSLSGNVLSARSADHDSLLAFVASLRSAHGQAVRVSINPPRQ